MSSAKREHCLILLEPVSNTKFNHLTNRIAVSVEIDPSMRDTWQREMLRDKVLLGVDRELDER